VPGDPRMRASDADRDRAASLLREHHAEGRLTAEEFNDRLDRAFAAKTQGELDELFADLPAIDLYRLPASGIRPAPPGAVRRKRGYMDRHGGGPLSGDGPAAWFAWVAMSGLLFVAWAGFGLFDGGAAWLPWFLLFSVPWALYLLRRRRG
jgi:uncharacterized protein DUF1707